jgi:hypothetical protein
MRAAVFVFAVVTIGSFTSGTLAAPPGPYSSAEGKYKVRFTDTPKVTTKNTETDLGDLTVTVATYATSDGNVYMVSYTDLPAAPKPQNHTMLFAGVRDGVKGNGKVTEDKEFEFGSDKLPGREFLVEKGKQRIRFRVILREGRLYQIGVIGTEAFAKGDDAKLFFDSFELTK